MFLKPFSPFPDTLTPFSDTVFSPKGSPPERRSKGKAAAAEEA